jgi:DNA-binding NtrC family response regulator
LPTLPLGRGETVLVVEDERDQLLREEEILAALGYEPVGFPHADDALAACKDAPDRFDMLVVGHLVPTTSTLEVAAALHEIVPGLPILLATASADDISTDLLVAAGISDVVQWPIVTHEIAAALERCSVMRRFEGRAQLS